MIYDLSLPLNNEIPSFPGTMKQNIEQLATVDQEGWNSKKLSFNSHYSTHIDAPRHMQNEGKTLTDYPADKFAGEAIVLDARNMKTIDLPTDAIKTGDIVFLYTGQIEKILTDDYFNDAPVLSKDFARRLVDLKISMIGMDAPSPDDAPYDLHHLFFNNDILIIENMTNLHQIAGRRLKCVVAPLKIDEADGAPCRVFAAENF